MEFELDFEKLVDQNVSVLYYGGYIDSKSFDLVLTFSSIKNHEVVKVVCTNGPDVTVRTRDGKLLYLTKLEFNVLAGLEEE